MAGLPSVEWPLADRGHVSDWFGDARKDERTKPGIPALRYPNPATFAVSPERARAGDGVVRDSTAASAAASASEKIAGADVVRPGRRCHPPTAMHTRMPAPVTASTEVAPAAREKSRTRTCVRTASVIAGRMLFPFRQPAPKLLVRQGE
jgi:hypothetical protein